MGVGNHALSTIVAWSMHWEPSAWRCCWGAFLANVAGRLRADGSAYQAMNAGGAGLLTWYSAQLGVWVFVILESVWTVAALWNLARAVTRARAS
jgi:hypothetical protein